MRASDYCVQVHRWLRDHKDSGSTEPGDPRAVIGWYSDAGARKDGTRDPGFQMGQIRRWR